MSMVTFGVGHGPNSDNIRHLNTQIAGTLYTVQYQIMTVLTAVVQSTYPSILKTFFAILPNEITI